MNVRDKIINLMITELSGKSNQDATNVITYTNKILSLIDKDYNACEYTMLHTGQIPKCCVGCKNYKEGEVCVCNCALPALEQFSYNVGDNNGP